MQTPTSGEMCRNVRRPACCNCIEKPVADILLQSDDGENTPPSLPLKRKWDIVKMAHPTPHVGHRQTNNGERTWQDRRVSRASARRRALVGARVASGQLLETLVKRKPPKLPGAMPSFISLTEGRGKAVNAVDYMTPTGGGHLAAEWCLLVHELKATRGFRLWQRPVCGETEWRLHSAGSQGSLGVAGCE